MPDFIFDNTVLSNFAAIGRTDLLAGLFKGNAFTTVEVVEELRRGIDKGYSSLVSVLAATENTNGWLQTVVMQSHQESRLRQELDELLHPGESSCIALAASRNMILVTDDLAARKAAARRNVRLTGTVGLLLEMVRSSVLPIAEGNTLLKKMTDSGYRSPVNRLDELF